MGREVLPKRRYSESFEMVINQLEFAIQVGFYEDGRIAEVFVVSQKIGSMAEIGARDEAVLLSTILQYGADPKKMIGSLTHDANGRPEGTIGRVLEKLIEMYCN